jgi:transposase-like protein
VWPSIRGYAILRKLLQANGRRSPQRDRNREAAQLRGGTTSGHARRGSSAAPVFELNNQAENSHQPTREREKRLRRFKSAGHAQRFVEVHGIIGADFRLRRHLLTAGDYCRLRSKRF